MFGFQAPRQRPGKATSVAAVNRPLDAVARLARSRVGSGMASNEAAGILLPFSTGRRLWVVRLTSVGTGGQAGQYGWQAIAGDRANPGTFLDVLDWSGTLSLDPAFEDNLNHNLTVGSQSNTCHGAFNGQMVDEAIYNRALSDAEIQQLFNYTKGL